MSTHFPKINERRYAQYPRRYSNEYTFDGRTRSVENYSFKSSCATLVGAKTAAMKAIEHYDVGIVRIFDRLKGEYVNTYKRSSGGIARFAGCVK